MESRLKGKWGRTCSRVAFALAFVSACVFILWKCPYGFGNQDESFYLTIPLRICEGDLPLWDEWHLSQLSSVFLVLPMRMQLALCGGMDGVVLHFRYLFTFAWMGISLFAFYGLRRFSWVGAACASLLLLVYAPYGIMALSYNSMGILFALASWVTLCHGFGGRCWRPFVAGVLGSCALLCCSYLVALWVCWLVWLVVRAVMRRDVRESRNLFVAYSLGMLSVGLAYLAFLLSHVRLNDLLESLRLMMGDPEHAQTSLVLRLKSYAKAILKSSSLAGPGMVTMLTLGLAGRFREGLRPPLLLGAWAVASAMQVSFSKFYINYCMFPVSMVGLMVALAWGESSEVNRVFWGIWLPGVAYGLCIHFSSNQAFYAISSAMAVSAVASVVLTGIALGDLDHVGRVDRLTSGAVVVCVLANVLLLVVLRYSSVFWERSMQDQVALATSGPERGVLMTKEKLRAYEADLADVAQLNAICPDGTLLCYSEHTWLYLVSPTHRFATYSAWLSGLSDTTIKRLGAYYKLHPQKVPDVIYVERREDVPALRDMLVGRRYEEVALGHGSSVLVGTAQWAEG